MRSESPIAIAYPVDDDRDGNARDLCSYRGLPEVIVTCYACAQKIENTDVDNESDESNDAKLEPIRDDTCPQSCGARNDGVSQVRFVSLLAAWFIAGWQRYILVRLKCRADVLKIARRLTSASSRS